MEIHTRQLRYFLAVAETGSYRQAARQLYVSQPSLSRAIKQLESSLGARLFERSTRGTALTAAGFSIAEPARRLVESLDRAYAQISPGLNSKTAWRVAHTPESLERALGCVVGAITESWPTQDFVCHEMPQAEVADAVLTGSCDLGLGIGPPPWPELCQEIVGREPLAALVEHDGRLATGPLSAERLRGRTIVLPPPSQAESVSSLVQHELAALGLDGQAVMGELPGLWRERLARPGIAFAIVERSNGRNDDPHSWVVRELPPPFTVQHTLYWLSDAAWEARAVQIIEPARRAWQALAELSL